MTPPNRILHSFEITIFFNVTDEIDTQLDWKYFINSNGCAFELFHVKVPLEYKA